MNETFLDAGVMDIVWFLLKVGLAIFIIWFVFMMIGGILETDAGPTIIGGLIFLPLLLYGIYVALSWGIGLVVGKDLAPTYVIWGIGGFIALAFIGFLIEWFENLFDREENERGNKKMTHIDIPVKTIFEAEQKVNRGEVLTGDDYDVFVLNPKSAEKILAKNKENIEQTERGVIPLSKEDRDNSFYVVIAMILGMIAIRFVSNLL